jgi:hypothetical protein
MQNKENVPTVINEPEQEVVMQESQGEASSNEGSAALGKFKDVDALLKAYGCLQAEFTRRSQRLKELERQMDTLQGERSGEALAEKLRKNAQARKAEEEKFDSFIAQNERASMEEIKAQSAQETPQEDLPEGSLQTRLQADGAATQTGESRKTAENAKTQSTGVRTPDDIGQSPQVEEAQDAFAAARSRGSSQIDADALYRQAIENEDVRLKIIGEYLSSIGKSGAPLLSGGVGATLLPPQKPKSIKEAGSMALCMFQKGNAEA